MLLFQLLLLVLLALPLLAGQLGFVLLSGAYALVLAALAFKAVSFAKRHQPAAALFLAFFSVLSLGATLALLSGVSVFWIAGFMFVLLAGFFIAMAAAFSTAECELLGWTNGYAVINVLPSLVALMPAGVYAVACPHKPVGKTVKVRFSFFDKKGKVV